MAAFGCEAAVQYRGAPTFRLTFWSPVIGSWCRLVEDEAVEVEQGLYKVTPATLERVRVLREQGWPLADVFYRVLGVRLADSGASIQ